MTNKPKRGRPPSEVTVEKRMFEESLRHRPTGFKPMIEDEKIFSKNWLESSEKISVEILKIHKHGQSTPNKHAYEMASLGDETLERHESRILAADDYYKNNAKKIRRSAGRAMILKTQPIKLKVIEINQFLIAKIGTTKRYSVHAVATIISNQWFVTTVGQILSNEPKNLERRGEGVKKPSVRTIERWIKDTSFDKPKS